MTARLARICRFPVKSIGGEDLTEVALTPGQALPGDRRFGLMHSDALRHLEDGALCKWLPKSSFARGAAAPALQAVRGGWRDGRLHLTHPDLPPLEFDPEADPEALARWAQPLWAPSGKAPAVRVVEGPFPLTDVKKPWLSMLSLSSLAAVEAKLGRPLGMDRWRGNLWIDGWEPFLETGLRLHRLRIGEVEFKLTERIDRCPATSVDTATGHLDGDVPAELTQLYGHPDFGVYLDVRSAGTIRVGDAVELL